MIRANRILPVPLFFCAAGFLFCLWDVLGGGPKICFTAGCAIYGNASVGGVSLWHVGMFCFAFMGLLALLGRAKAGYCIAWTGLLVDALLLALMVATAPCFNCLIVALILFLVLRGFRSALQREARYGQKQARQILVLVWSALFLCNVGIVLKALSPLYCMTDNDMEAKVHMFFSPSCPSCRQGIEKLSGSIDTAFYPIAETEMDVPRIARMQELLDNGVNMKDALQQSKDDPSPKSLSGTEYLFLMLKLLSNKAHVYLNAGPVVPYFEYRGLPAHLARQKNTHAGHAQSLQEEKSAAIPIQSPVDGSCYGGTKDCDDEDPSSMTTRK